MTSGSNSFRYAPDDTFYDISGHGFFPERKDQYWLLAYANTNIFSELKKVFNSTFHCQVGDVAKIVVPKLGAMKEKVTQISMQCVLNSKTDWDSYETSWDFVRHPLVRAMRNQWPVTNESNPPLTTTHPPLTTTFADHYNAWKDECNNRFLQLQSNEEELNRILIDIYGLQDELTPEAADRDITVHRIYDTKDDVPESM